MLRAVLRARCFPPVLLSIAMVIMPVSGRAHQEPKKPEKTSELKQTVARLFGVKPVVEKGIVSLTYTKPDELAGDIIVKAKSDHFQLGVQNSSGESRYLFTGNTHGVLLLDAIFENDVTLEFEVQFQLVLANDPYFMIMVMSDGGEKFYASNFGTDLRIYKEARESVRSPSRVEKYNGHPGRWLQRRHPVRLKLQYKKPNNERKGTLRVWFDGKEVCRRTTSRHQRGAIGLTWNNVKFTVSKIHVRGKLDEKWARKKLLEEK